MENTKVVPQRVKNRFTIRSSNTITGYTFKRIKSRVSKRYLCTIFIARLFTIARKYKQPNPLIDDGYIHITEYYSALKIKEILIYGSV